MSTVRVTATCSPASGFSCNEEPTMNRQDFLAISAFLSAGVGKPMPPQQLEVYYDLLRDLPTPAVQQAARRALQEGQYPVIPPIGVLRRLALEIVRGAWPPPTAAENTRRIAREREADRADSDPQALGQLVRALLSRPDHHRGEGQP